MSLVTAGDIVPGQYAELAIPPGLWWGIRSDSGGWVITTGLSGYPDGRIRVRFAEPHFDDDGTLCCLHELELCLPAGTPMRLVQFTPLAPPGTCRHCGRTGTQLEVHPCCDRPEHAGRNPMACADWRECLAFLRGQAS